jgi:hypothetical protein
MAGTPGSIGRAVRTSEDDRVAVGIAQPDFPMVGTAVVIGWVAVARQDDLRLQFGGADNSGVEVSNFKPEKHAVSGRELRIANPAVMILFLPGVELKDQLAVGNEALVVRTAVGTLTAKKTLIPATARLNISRANQGL